MSNTIRTYFAAFVSIFIVSCAGPAPTPTTSENGQRKMTVSGATPAAASNTVEADHRRHSLAFRLLDGSFAGASEDPVEGDFYDVERQEVCDLYAVNDEDVYCLPRISTFDGADPSAQSTYILGTVFTDANCSLQPVLVHNDKDSHPLSDYLGNVTLQQADDPQAFLFKRIRFAATLYERADEIAQPSQLYFKSTSSDWSGVRISPIVIT